MFSAGGAPRPLRLKSPAKLRGLSKALGPFQGKVPFRGLRLLRRRKAPRPFPFKLLKKASRSGILNDCYKGIPAFSPLGGPPLPAGPFPASAPASGAFPRIALISPC